MNIFLKKRIFALAWLLVYFVCTLFFLPKSSATPVVAETSTYAYIHTDTAYFYSTKNENSGLFVLPKTYFVKVLTTETEYCRIEYLYDSAYTKKLNGFAKTSELTFVDFIPNEPYLYHVFDVRYTIDGALSGDNSFLDQITVTCAYYGDYKIGTKSYCYVLRGDSFGYIPKPDDLYYNENTEYEEYLASQTPPDDTEVNGDNVSEGEGMSAAQIAILVTLCILVPLLAALVLKSPKKHPYDTTDENV